MRENNSPPTPQTIMMTVMLKKTKKDLYAIRIKFSGNKNLFELAINMTRKQKHRFINLLKNTEPSDILLQKKSIRVLSEILIIVMRVALLQTLKIPTSAPNMTTASNMRQVFLFT